MPVNVEMHSERPIDPRLSQNLSGSCCGSDGVSISEVRRDPMKTGMNSRGCRHLSQVASECCHAVQLGY